MHLIILSGGFGKRLWPLSNSARPKQFLKLLSDDKEKKESMIQRIYRQITQVGGWDSICFASCSSQGDLLNMQLGENVDLVLEPSQRDTFPAIALASMYLYSEKSISKDEMVAVIPVDSYVDIDFFSKIKKMEEVFSEENINDTSFLLMGVKPTEATEKYGYICPDYNKVKDGVYQVKSFKEKPDRVVAAELIKNGALWNCGVFGFRLGQVIDIVKERYIGEKEINYSKLRKLYMSLPKNSFDYEVLETAKKVKVIPYEGNWSDLGTWETMSSILKDQISGNVTLGCDSCKNTHIINELDIPVLLMGIDDSVVVVTADGILLSAKSEAHRIKNLLNSMSERPMSETRRWGTYRVLNKTKNTLTKILIINPGKSISYQYHNNRKEIWSIVSGEGLLYLEGDKRDVGVGEVIEISKGMKHGIKAITELHIIEIQVGKDLREDDIFRLELDWD